MLSYGLNPLVYIDTGGARVTESVTREEICISVLPSLPSTPRKVSSGHGTKSPILYLHSPTVWPKDIVRLSGYPLIQDSLIAPELGFNDDESGAQFCLRHYKAGSSSEYSIEDFGPKESLSPSKIISAYHRRENNISKNLIC